MEKILKGIGASKGLIIAKVWKLETAKIDIPNEKMAYDQAKKIFDANLKKTINDIDNIITKVSKTLSKEEVQVFEAHKILASDPAMIKDIDDLLKTNEYNVAKAVDQVATKYINIFKNIDDPYLKARVADVQDVTERMIKNILKIESVQLASIKEKVIIVAHDLSPSETAQLNKEFVVGFATNIGAITSHAAIMAQSMAIPAILGLGKIMNQVANGDEIVLDVENNSVIIHPSAITKAKVAKRIVDFQEEQTRLIVFKDKKSFTKDGKRIEVAANIGNVKDLAQVIEKGAEAIGLFRTEFLYMESANWPTEEEQFQAYKEILAKMQGKKVVVRTLDIGGDKILNYFTFDQELNPFLGLRAIRFSLHEKKNFEIQLRALIRASQFGQLSIMFPMIATVNEFKKAKAFFETVFKKVKQEHPQVSNNIELGLMIETPAAAIIADKFAKYADFLSIGTNDLIQYTMAADRLNENVAYLYQPLNPSILHLIKLTIDGAHQHNSWVGMCGAMAGDPKAIQLLVGMGIDELSMSPALVLKSKFIVSKLDSKEAKKIVELALAQDSEEEVLKLLK